MLNYLWTLIILFSIFVAAWTGNMEAVCNSILESAGNAVDLLMVMLGVISMWNGFLSVAEGSGLTAQLAGKMQPLIHFLFPKLPKDHPACSHICANFIANLLGLGWACTPTGLAAMKSLQQFDMEQGKDGTVASNEMCTFLILNISSLQIIPINMIAYRNQYGSANPMAIIGPGLVATTLTTLLAAVLCRALSAAFSDAACKKAACKSLFCRKEGL